MKITQSTVAAACLAVAAIFASGYGLGLLSRRHADQAELLEANHQRALALQAVAQAHQEKATMMASLMQHFRGGPQSLSETPHLAANEPTEDDAADLPLGQSAAKWQGGRPQH